MITDEVILDNDRADEEDEEDEEELEIEEANNTIEINIAEWLKSINNRLIKTLGSEGYDLQVGHSYFLSKGEVITEPGQFINILKYELIPLLAEYTYNNISNMKSILGIKLFDSSDELRKELFNENEFANLIEALEE